MISKQKCVCITCGRGFTRRTSGNRHNFNLHSGMSIIVESSLYYIGISQGKYPTPDPTTSIRTRYCTPLNPNYPSHFNIDDKPIFNNFFKDNAALIDCIIEIYVDKLKPFLSEEEINKFVTDCIIRPITSTYINNREELNRQVKMLNNVVGYIRIKRRLGDKTELIFPDIKFERMKIL
ncbi:MAG: hypothetical protein ACXWE0_05765 [Nitrososphaeraceae archaeon]